MSNISMSDAELLKFAIENGMLDAALVQEKIEMQKREELLKKHPYAIWEGKDGKWYTYLPDEKRKRVPRKRKSYAEIENIIVEYWKEQQENPTVEDVFCEWLNAKLGREEISKSTYDRYKVQFEQCFKKLKGKKIKLITEYDIEEFILNIVHELKLTQKAFSNFRTLIYGIFKHAKKRKLIQFSITQVVADIEISRKNFRKDEKSDDEQVFMIDELPKVIDYLSENGDIINLGLLLIFKTGLRIGELSALKSVDIDGTVIHVNRTEIRYKGDDKKMVYEVRDFPKTDAGVRDVILPDKYAWVIKKIKLLNPFGEYLFERDGERIRTYIFRTRLYTVCKNIQSKKKSPHKARKTYGSILIDSGVPESTVINQMGHTDIKTTKEHYYKNRRSIGQIRDEINKVSGLAN